MLYKGPLPFAQCATHAKVVITAIEAMAITRIEKSHLKIDVDETYYGVCPEDLMC